MVNVVQNYESKQGCYNCFLPPHVLHSISVNHPDKEIRSIADQTIENGKKFRSFRRSLQEHYEFHQYSVNTHHSEMMGALKIERPVAVIYNAFNKSDLPGKIVKPEITKDQAALEAYQGAMKTYQFFLSKYKRDSIDDSGMQIISTVHYKENFDNAFWNGTQMVYGDGDVKIFNRFTSALDVIGHELTHGITEHTANLEYQKQSGALNESMSDVFGIMIKQADKKWTVTHPDAWLVGDELLNDIGKKKVALRSLSAPGTAYVNHQFLGTDPQPATMDNYKELPLSEDEGGVHVNSGIPNHAFYLASMTLGSVEDTGKIWYDTLQNIQSTTDFHTFAVATVSSSTKLYGKNSEQTNALRKAWNETKVTIYKIK